MSRLEREWRDRPKFQEDEELYEEKARKQMEFAKNWKNLAKAITEVAGTPAFYPTTCPAGSVPTTCPAGFTPDCPAQRTAICPYALSGSPRSIRPPGLEIANHRSLALPEIIIGGVESDVKIVSGKSWRRDQAKSEEVMVQNLEKNPTFICVDSGAGESVCPVDYFRGSGPSLPHSSLDLASRSFPIPSLHHPPLHQ